MSVVHGGFTHAEGAAWKDPECPNCHEEDLRARLAAAEAVVEAARRLANGEDTNTSWTALGAALAAYDKARGAR